MSGGGFCSFGGGFCGERVSQILGPTIERRAPRRALHWGGRCRSGAMFSEVDPTRRDVSLSNDSTVPGHMWYFGIGL